MKFNKRVSLILALLFVVTNVPVRADETAAAPNDVFVTLTRTNRSQQDLPANTQVLTPGEFNGWSAETGGQAAQRMTSVQVQSTGGLGSVETAQIRGARTSQNLLLIDGRPVGGVAFGASQDLAEIPVEEIDHIEVVRGGVSALYGPNAMGGVLNVITRRSASSQTPTATAGYDYGSYGRTIFRGTAGAKSGPLDVFAYGDTQHEDGFRQNSQADTINGGGNIGLALPGASKLLIDGSIYQAQTGVPGLLFVPTNQFNNDIERQASTPTAQQNTDHKTVRSEYRLPLPMSSLLTLKAWDSEREVVYKDPFNDSDRVEASKGGSVQMDLPYGFVFGSDFLHDREDSTDHVTPTNTFIRSAENYAFFAQETMKWEAITLIPSGRFDHHSAFGDTANPRVQLMIDAANWLRFSGSSARSFRAPSIDDLYYPFTDFGTFADPFSGRSERSTYTGNPNLRPETAWTYDAGFELHADSTSLKATYFRSDVRNLIQTLNTFTFNSGTPTDPDLFASQVINVGYARRQGLEFQADHRLNEYVSEGANYTYLNNVGIPVGATKYVLLAYSPRHTANAFLTLSPTSVLDWTHTLRYEGTRFTGNDQTGTKLGSVLLWDMRLAYKWQRLDLYFQVRDVTDRRYEEQDGFPLPGRTFIGGVTMHFGGGQ